LTAGAPSIDCAAEAETRSEAIMADAKRSILVAGAVAGACWLAGGRALAATQVVAPSDDTFINQGNPSNNNGATLSIFTGTDGHGGIMRGLVRFGMPGGLQGRVTVTGVQLTMTAQALGNGAAGADAVESLQAVTQAWVQGNGIGDAPSSFTVGQVCGGSISGATWNQANCTTGTSWTTAGGTVAAAVSGQASTAGVPIGGQVVWSSAANARMSQDVQGWIDDPTSNHGWRIASSTEGETALAQRFFSSEAGSSAPSLAISYTCNAGFVAAGNACVAAPPVPAAGPRAIGILALLLAALATVVLRRQTPSSGFQRR
jgi:hypothetical protein